MSTRICDLHRLPIEPEQEHCPECRHTLRLVELGELDVQSVATPRPTPVPGDLDPLACPFCGSAAIVKEDRFDLPGGRVDVMYFVECCLRECGNRTRSWFPKVAAVKAWNTRGAAQAPELEAAYKAFLAEEGWQHSRPIKTAFEAGARLRGEAPGPAPVKCPRCDGQGRTMRPPWVAGDAPGWDSTTIASHPCPPCKGTGILWPAAPGEVPASAPSPLGGAYERDKPNPAACCPVCNGFQFACLECNADLTEHIAHIKLSAAPAGEEGKDGREGFSFSGTKKPEIIQLDGSGEAPPPTALPSEYVAGLRDAALAVLDHLNHPREEWAKLNAPEDPEIEALCRRHGYGAVMDSASRQWYRKDRVGAHVVNMAAGSEAVLAQKLRKAISGSETAQPSVSPLGANRPDPSPSAPSPDLREAGDTQNHKENA